jgi:hypothetical protein
LAKDKYVLELLFIVGLEMGRVTLAGFIRNWQDKISRIEKSSLDDDAVRGIKADFELNNLEIKMSLSKEDVEAGALVKLSILKSELYAALGKANSRFKLENPFAVSRVGNFFNGMLEGTHQ